MRKLPLALALFASLAPIAAQAQTPLMLFNGSSLLGWNQQGAWSASGGNLASSGSGERHILTAMPFGEMSLQFEYNESTNVGAKLHLWAGKNNDGGLVVDLDNSGAPAGVGGVETLAHSAIGTVSEGWHRVSIEASHGQVQIQIDTQQAATTSGLGARAGYIGFEANTNGLLQIRNVKLVPHGLNNLFNGSDLSGWKSISRGPDAKGGVGHAMEKTFSFGIAGGSTKPHDAKWSVQGGAIHGENGPGGLENGTMVEDAILQVTAQSKGEVKPDNYTSLVLRSAQGQLSGGYAVGLGAYAGGIEPVAKRPPTQATNAVDETIVIAGRTIAVWIGSTLTAVHTDTRAEGSNTTQGAKTSSGTVTIQLPNGGEQVDLKHVSMAALPKNYGVAAKAPPPPPAPAPAAAPQAAAPPPSAAETALLQQQQATAKKDADDEAKKTKSASLMNQALATNDPQQQMSLYAQIVQIDPSNAAAVQGYKEAQTKLQSQQSAQQQQATQEIHQQQDAQSKDQQTTASLVEAQSDFLNGHLSQAGTVLGTAERLSPSNPLVRDLRSRISSAESLRSRLYFLGGGVGLVGIAGLFAMWLHRRRQQRYAVLEITRGLDSGRSFPLDKDLIRIGAVPQDGGQKNDFVIQDVEHAISRFHCEVARKNGQLYVTDLRSSNGTRVNGESLKPGSPTLLRRGSLITLANSVDLKLGYQRRSKKGA